MKIIYGFLTTILLTLQAAMAAAATCPEDAAYIEFGLADKNFDVVRSGVLLNVTPDSGVILSATERQDCMPYIGTIQPRSDPGGKPIPVVTDAWLSGATASENITMLHVSSNDTIAEALPGHLTITNIHFEAVASGQFDVTRGENFICASIGVPFVGAISCEIPSLTRDPISAVVDCSEILCLLRVMVDHDLFVTIRWDATGESLASPFTRGVWIEEIATDAINLVTSSLTQTAR